MHNDQLSTEIIEYFHAANEDNLYKKVGLRDRQIRHPSEVNGAEGKLHATSINKLSGDQSILFLQKVKSKVKVYVSKVVRTLRTK